MTTTHIPRCKTYCGPLKKKKEKKKRKKWLKIDNW
jgi:hypothetical protein